MKGLWSAFTLGISSATLVSALVPLYGQCGGSGYTGETQCVAGATCVYSNEWYSQCLAGTATTTATTATSTAAPTGIAAQKANIGYASLNGGTSGGIGGASTTVSSLAALKTAVADDTARIVWVSGTITGNESVKVGSNKSILGLPGATLSGVGIGINDKKNVIIRNLKITKVLAEAGDGIGVQGTSASNIWIDHVDVSSDKDHDKDYYDGLIDVTHGVRYVTISHSYLHDHFKGSLVGASDSNTEDTAILITYAYNHWKNVGSRGPSLRFGTGHIYNSYFDTVGDAVHTRVGAQVLVENNVFVSVGKPIYATSGFAVARNNDYGGGSNAAPAGTLTSVPYSYSTIANASLKGTIVGKSGATL